MQTKRISLIIVVVLIIGLGVIIVMNLGHENELQAESSVLSNQSVDTAPAFTATDISGKVFDLQAEIGEKSIIITSMATFCSSCIQNSVNLNQALTDSGRDDIEVLAVSIDPTDDTFKLLDFRNRYANISWYVFESEAGSPKIRDLFDFKTIDQTIGISKDSVIVDRYNRPRSKEEWLEAIEKI